MGGFGFYFYLGLITSMLFARGVPSDPLGWVAVALVNGLAVLLWVYFLGGLFRRVGAERRAAQVFVLASPFTYLVGLMGGLMVMGR